MRKIFNTLKTKLKFCDAVLCSIIASSGSTPRGRGAKMIVFSDDTTIGTIGGGAVEYKATQIAKDILKTKSSKLQEFELNSNDVLDLGMICGGKVSIYFRYFSKESNTDFEIINYISSLFNRDEKVWLITEVSEERTGFISTYCESDGIKYSNLRFEEIKNYLLGKACYIKDKYLIEPLFRTGYTYIFGGGHVSQALVPILSKLDFRPVVLDDRIKFCDKKLFKGVEYTKLIDFNNPDIIIKKEDNIVIMTRGHKDDFNILSFALSTPCSYLGLIGSKNKWKKTTEKLQEMGFTEENYSKVHNPIGIEIFAETPDEISISIAAEMIKYRAQRA